LTARAFCQRPTIFLEHADQDLRPRLTALALLSALHSPFSIPSPHTANMRPLTEPETKTLFEKLATYCGKGISDLIADPAGGNDRNVFRVQVRSALCSLPAALC
jgi:hypothetical protein